MVGILIKRKNMVKLKRKRAHIKFIIDFLENPLIQNTCFLQTIPFTIWLKSNF